MSQLVDNKALLTTDADWDWPPFEDARTQIRLLRFQPVQDDGDVISAALKVFSLDSAPAFYAISYTWGSAAHTTLIKINETAATVRPNCSFALWQTRLHFPDAFVWLDAICINQDDLEEKSVQVALMGDVYAKAAKVLACVGPADACSDEIRDALLDLDAALLPSLEGAFDDENAEEQAYRDEWCPPRGEDYARKICEDHYTFLSREYFRRVWIIQELFGGSHRHDCISILCGSYQLDWNGILELENRVRWVEGAFYFRYGSLPIESAIYHLNILFSLCRNDEFLLNDLLSHVRSYECHDPRDRIFGTYRLLNWTRFNKKSPVPNYHISPSQLAIETITQCDRPSLGDVENLRQILQLDQLELCSSGEHLASVTASSIGNDQTREFWDTFRGIGTLVVDTGGRLFLELTTIAELAPTPREVLESLALFQTALRDPNGLSATHGFISVHTNNEASMLICSDAQVGDIIADSSFGHIVLRRLEEKFDYVVVGPALAMKNPRAGQQYEDAACPCWQQDQLSKYDIFPVYFSVQMSNEDAIVAVCAHTEILAGRSNVLHLLRSRSLGALSTGKRLRDITLSWVGKDKIFGPTEALCSKHKMVDPYRRSGEALMYSSIMQDGATIYASKQ